MRVCYMVKRSIPFVGLGFGLLVQNNSVWEGNRTTHRQTN